MQREKQLEELSAREKQHEEEIKHLTGNHQSEQKGLDEYYGMWIDDLEKKLKEEREKKIVTAAAVETVQANHPELEQQYKQKLENEKMHVQELAQRLTEKNKKFAEKEKQLGELEQKAEKEIKHLTDNHQSEQNNLHKYYQSEQNEVHQYHEKWVNKLKNELQEEREKKIQIAATTVDNQELQAQLSRQKNECIVAEVREALLKLQQDQEEIQRRSPSPQENKSRGWLGLIRGAHEEEESFVVSGPTSNNMSLTLFKRIRSLVADTKRSQEERSSELQRIAHTIKDEQRHCDVKLTDALEPYMEIALENGEQFVIEQLLHMGVDINKPTKKGLPIYVPAKKGNLALLQWMIEEKGANVFETPHSSIFTAMFNKSGYVGVVDAQQGDAIKHYLEHDASLSPEHKQSIKNILSIGLPEWGNGISGVENYLKTRNKDVAQRLMQIKNQVFDDIDKKYIEIVKYINNKIDNYSKVRALINKSDNTGATPLVTVTAANRVNLIQELLSLSADDRDANGNPITQYTTSPDTHRVLTSPITRVITPDYAHTINQTNAISNNSYHGPRPPGLELKRDDQ